MTFLQIEGEAGSALYDVKLSFKVPVTENEKHVIFLSQISLQITHFIVG